MAAIESCSLAAPLAGAPATAVRAEADAFARFARAEHHGLVQLLRSHTPSLQDAEDAAQESIIKLMRYRGSVPSSDWPHLLYRIAINTAHDRFRAARRRHALVEASAVEPDLGAHECCPDEYAAHEQALASMRRAILGLPPKCRRVCVLRLTRDLTNAEIASLCGVSTKMVEKHLAHGIDILRRKVGNRASAAFRQA